MNEFLMILTNLVWKHFKWPSYWSLTADDNRSQSVSGSAIVKSHNFL